MNNLFKKICDITFHEKIFTIFVDEKHRYTFLEKKDGKYIYPTKEDYLALYKIYNEHEPFVFHSPRKYTFKEKVRMGTTLLSIYFLLVTGLLTDASSKTPYNYATIEEIDNFFGSTEIYLSTIDNALKINKMMDEPFKIRAHNLAVAIYKEYPDADLRKYCSNLLTLETVAMTKEEYKEKFQNYSNASYNARENKIYYQIGCKEQTIYHELGHVVEGFYKIIDDQVYSNYQSSYTALEEVMNNKVVNFIMPTTSYSNIEKVVDYLFTFVPFDFNNYNEKGASYLIYDLKKKYPKIDVSYINDCLNVMKDSASKNGQFIYAQDCPELLDELFCLCKEKVHAHMLEVYAPFLDFAKLISTDETLFASYLQQYNACLKEYSIENILTVEELQNKVLPFKEVKGFFQKEEEWFPYYFSDDVTKYPHYPVKSCFSLELKKMILKNPNLEINSSFWKQFLIEQKYATTEQLYKTKVLFNGHLLTENYLNQLKIQVGLTKTGQIGFLVTDFFQEIIYQSAENMQMLSNPVLLMNYYPICYENKEELELSALLNETYLKEVQKEKSLFYNIVIEKNAIFLEPLYVISLIKGPDVHTINQNQCFFTYTKKEEEDFIQVGEQEIKLHTEKPFSGIIRLKTILEELHLLEENTASYSYTEDELKNLVEVYVEGLENFKTR